MDRTIFNNIPINISHAITREDRNMDEFKCAAKLIETLFDKIKEENPMAYIDLRSFEYTGYHESYICKSIIRRDKREIIINNFNCIKFANNPIVQLHHIGFYFCDMDYNAGFPQQGEIEFDIESDDIIDNKLIDLLVKVFKTFLNTGEVIHTYISKDELE